MLSREVKVRAGIIVSVILAISVAIGGYFWISNNAGAEIGKFDVTQATDVMLANADDAATQAADTGDKGEIQKGDIVDYYLEATYIGFGDSKSGLVTISDQLPDGMELVTSGGSAKNPTVEGAVNKWADGKASGTASSSSSWTISSDNRTFTGYLANIPADASGSGSTVKIHIWAKVTKDASSENVDNMYYTNYFTVAHGGASVTSNKVQFHSGNPSDETFTITYTYTNAPSGLTAPAGTTETKGSLISLASKPSYPGYKFNGWNISGGTPTGVTLDKDKNTLQVNKGTSIVSITLVGDWSQQDTINVTYEWQGRESSLTGSNSPDDKPDASVPSSSKPYVGTPVKIPAYPRTSVNPSADSNDQYTDLYKQYTFLGWRIQRVYNDASTDTDYYTLTSAETNAGEFIPTPASGKTLKGVKFIGCWTKKSFKVTISQEGVSSWPSGITKPNVGSSIKWGTNFTLSDLTSSALSAGYRFNGWRIEPDLGKGADVSDGKQFTMPASNITVYASFTKLQTVTMKSGSASTSNQSWAASIKAAPGEVVSIKPLKATKDGVESDMEDVRFKDWSTTVATDANNWIKKDDGTATFVMPDSSVTITGQYQTEIDFLVVNGSWSDGSSGFKSELIDMTQADNGTWSGTLASGKVPTGMKNFPSHTDSGSWDTIPPTSTDYFKANASGTLTSGKTLYTYTFGTPVSNITIKYKVADSDTSRGFLTTPDSSDEKQEATDIISPITDTPPNGVTAHSKMNGIKFGYWEREGWGDSQEDAYSIDATFVPYKESSVGGTTEYYQAATYIAHFIANQYSIKFNANGDNVEGNMDDQQFSVGDRTKITKNAFTKEGFKFGGWTTAADGSGSYYSDEEKLTSDLSTDDGDVINFYAKWVEDEGTQAGDATKGFITGYANNIRLTVDEAKGLAGKTDSTAKDSFVSKSNAYFMWSKEGERTKSVSVDSVESNGIKTTTGVYDVTLKSASENDVSATVGFKAYVYDGVETSGKASIGAQNFSVSKDEVGSLKLSDATNGKDALIKLAHASSWNVDTLDDLGIKSVTTAIKAEEGIYDVTFVGNNASDGNHAEITVKCTVFGKGASDATYRITGNDFAVKKGTTVSDADLIALGNAKAVFVDNGNDAGVTVDKGTFDSSKIGKYSIKYTVKGQSTPSITVTGTVFDNINDDANTGEVIGANDFSLSEYEASNITDAKIIELAHAKAYDKATGKDVSVSVSDKGGLTNKIGTYKITFKTVKNTSVTINAIVVGGSGSQNGIRISANDFTVSIEEAKQIITNNAVNKDRAIEFAKAKAVKESDGSDVGIASVTGSVKAEKGSYPLTFTSNKVAQKAASITANMIVTDKGGSSGEIEDPDRPGGKDKLIIHANDFSVSLKEVTEELLADPSANVTNLVKHASAVAQLESDGSNIEITEATSGIKAEKGTYDVKFKATYKNATAETTVKATVTDNSGSSDQPGVDPDENSVQITANSFKISIKEADGIVKAGVGASKESLVKYANAKAQKVLDGSSVDIASVAGDLEAERGTYELTFTSATVGTKNASVKVNAVVTDEVKRQETADVNPETGENDTIIAYANNFTVSKNEVEKEKLNENASLVALIRHAHAGAELASNGNNVGIASVVSGIKAEKGTYDVTFTTNEKFRSTAEITVKATVTDGSGEQGGSGDEEGKVGVRVTANNFTVTKDQVTSDKLTSGTEGKAKLIEYAKAKAEKLLDASKVEIATVDSRIKAEKGTYDVKFTSATVDEKVATVTVQATVTDKSGTGEGGDPVDPENPTGEKHKVNIHANDFMISSAQVKELNDLEPTEKLKSLVNYAKVTAEDSVDYNKVDIASVSGTINEDKGTYPIEFTSAKYKGSTAKVSINAIVVDEAKLENGIRIWANNFAVSLNDVKSKKLTDGAQGKDNLISLAGAGAVLDADFSNVGIDTVDSSIKEAIGTYDVKFNAKTSDNKTASITVKATVVGGTQDSPQGKVKISANNFTVSVKEVTDKQLGKDNTNLDNLVEYAKAKAIKTSDSSKVEIDSATSTIEPEKGTYEVEFKSAAVEGDVATIKVNAVVTDSSDVSVDGKLRITANNFTVSKKEVKDNKLNDSVQGLSKLVEYAKASAELVEDGTAIDISNSDSKIEAEKGTYDVTFYAKTDDSSASITVRATVTDSTQDTPGSSEGSDTVRMSANDFTVSVKDVETDSLSDGAQAKDKLISLAKAKAIMKSDSSDLGIATVDSKIEAKKGAYTVKFTSNVPDGEQTGASIEVTATVTDKSSSAEGGDDPESPSGKTKVNIYANDFRITIDEAKMINQLEGEARISTLVGAAHARAELDKDGSDVGIASVAGTIDEAKGTYPLTYTSNTVNQATAKITINAIVTDNSTTTPDEPGPDVDDKTRVKISANNFKISIADATALNNLGSDAQLTKLIAYANAKAEKVYDGSEVKVVSAESSIEAKKGTYKVTFKSETVGNNVASVDVYATVTDKSGSASGGTDPDDPTGKTRISIYANDFTVSLEEAKAIDDLKQKQDFVNYRLLLAKHAHAIANNEKDGSDVGIGGVVTGLGASKGDYEVTFESNVVNGVKAEVIVKGTVVDKTEGDPSKPSGGDDPENPDENNGIRMSANNFTVSIKEVEDQELGNGENAKDKLVKLASAKAVKSLDLSEIGIASVESKIEAKKGTYKVKYTSNNVEEGKNTSIEIDATVTDYVNRGDVVDPDDPDKSTLINIYANDFEMTVDEVKAMLDSTVDSESEIIDRAGARAEYISDRSPVIVEVTDSQIQPMRGVYPVVFSSDSDSNGKVVTIRVNATVREGGTRGETADIFANNFSVSVKEVQDLKLNDGNESKDTLIERAAAFAQDKEGNKVEIASVDSKIEDHKGYYDVTFKSVEVNGESVETTITASVKENSTEDADNKERIFANSFAMSLEDAENIVDGTTSETDAKAMMINLACAEAVSTVDGLPVDITEVDYSTLKAAPANYPIKFATDKGTSVTVFVTVTDDIVVAGNVSIYAKDFKTTVAEVEDEQLDNPEVSKLNLIARASAKAWDNQTFETLDFSEIISDIQAKRGSYDVVFTATNGTDTNSKTIKATIMDKKVEPKPDPKPDPDPDPRPDPDPDPKPDPDPDVPDPDQPDADVDIYAYANDITVSVKDVQEFNLDNGDVALEKLVQLANVEARRISDDNLVDIVKAESTIKAAKGNYTVKFETDKVNDKSLKIKVNATVTDSSSTTVDPADPSKSVVMYANNFTLSQAEAEAILNGTVLSDSKHQKAYADGVELNEGQKELIRLANVKAYKGEDSAEVDVTGVDFPFTGETGDYIATFKASSGNINAHIDVTGTVTDESVESAQNKERITANNILYTFEEAGELLAKSNDDIATQLAQDAQVSAISTEDFSAVDVTKAEWNIQQAEGVYDVTFSTEKGTDITVIAAVGQNPADLLARTGDNNMMFIYIVAGIAVLGLITIIVLCLKRRKNEK